MQRSLSLKNLMSPGGDKSLAKQYKEPQPTPPKRRESTFWVESVEGAAVKGFTKTQLERQEAIFELYKNEEDLIEDLAMVKSVSFTTIISFLVNHFVCDTHTNAETQRGY